MPIYEYRCRNGHQFEVFQAISDTPVSACKECGEPVERVFHPVAVHFKGSGFYTTDYARKAGAKASESPTASASKDAGSDSKSEKKDEAETRRAGEEDRRHLVQQGRLAIRLARRGAGRGPRRVVAEELLDRTGAFLLGDGDAPEGACPGGLQDLALELKPSAAESTNWGMVSIPMLETNAFGAFQPMSGPLMKLYGSRVMLVIRPLIPDRTSCWNWARSRSSMGGHGLPCGSAGRF